MGKKVIIPTEVLLASLQNFAKAFPHENDNWQKSVSKFTSPFTFTATCTYPPKRYMQITGLTKGQWQRFSKTGSMRGSEKKLKIIIIWANPHYHALYKAYLIKSELS